MEIIPLKNQPKEVLEIVERVRRENEERKKRADYNNERWWLDE